MRDYGSNSFPIENGNSGILCGMSAIELLVYALYILIAFWWTKTFFASLKPNWQSFQFMERSISAIGMISIALIYIFVLSVCIIGLIGIRRRQYHVSVGIFIVVMAMFMKIGMYVFDDLWAIESYKIIFYRVFHTYGSISTSSIIFGIITSVLTFSKANGSKGQRICFTDDVVVN